jgi:hypothetical protein
MRFSNGVHVIRSESSGFRTAAMEEEFEIAREGEQDGRAWKRLFSSDIGIACFFNIGSNSVRRQLVTL